MTKNCKLCLIIKPIYDFGFTNNKLGKKYRQNYCLICRKLKQEKYRNNNKNKIKCDNKKYYEKIKNTSDFKEKQNIYTKSRREVKKQYDAVYRTKNKQRYIDYCLVNRQHISETRHEWYLKNKECKKAYAKRYVAANRKSVYKSNYRYIKNRLTRDACFKLRTIVSKSIRNVCKKNFKSVINFLPYSINQLRVHLESLFEPWMNWNNWGKYKKADWNDNDQSTWTWNIDHIIPQSTLPYVSMEDNNFKKCWALNNLRPYSAKQNILDGAFRNRH